MTGLSSIGSAALPLTYGQSLESLSNSASKTSSEVGADEEATEVGREFESLFLSLLLKQLRSSLDEGLFQGDGSDVYGSMFDLMMGQSMAESSPLGITQLIERYMTRASNQVPSGGLNAAL